MVANITFSGLASGINTDDIVSKLLEVERLPLDNLNKQKTDETNRLAAYKSFNSLLNDLSGAVGDMSLTSQVQTTKANLSSESAFTATSSSASPGSYNIAVKQLAQVQKDISSGFSSSSSSLLGTGTFTINGPTSKVITIDSSNNSLQGLMAAINAESGTTGVSASIINDGSSGSPYHLILTGKDASSSFTVSSNLQDQFSNPITFTTTNVQTAQQALLTIDGIDVVSNSNTVTGVISGVTLNLNAVSAVTDVGPPPVYASTKMDIVADTSALEEKVTAFVSSYNKIMDWISSGYADNIPPIDSTTSSSTSTTSSSDSTTSTNGVTDAQLSKLLRGDATINSIKRGIQSILTDSVINGGSLHILSEIGISTNKDGTLNLNNTKLESTLQDNFSDVTKLLAGDSTAEGVMKKFNSYLSTTTSITQGMYAQKQTNYQSKIKKPGQPDLPENVNAQ